MRTQIVTLGILALTLAACGSGGATSDGAGTQDGIEVEAAEPEAAADGAESDEVNSGDASGETIHPNQGRADDCLAGDMARCTVLYWNSSSGTEYRAIAETCGSQGRINDGINCVYGDLGPDHPKVYGDNETLDALWDRCEADGGVTCDDLYWNSANGTEYWTFANSCGERSGENSPDGGKCWSLPGS